MRRISRFRMQLSIYGGFPLSFQNFAIEDQWLSQVFIAHKIGSARQAAPEAGIRE